jgi:hypothetical protein
MMQEPLNLTQADLPGLMEVGRTVSSIPGASGADSPLGGIGDFFSTIERGLNLWDQINKRVAESGMTIAKLRSVEQLGIQQEQGDFFPPGQVIEPGGVYRPPEPVRAEPEQGAGLPPITAPDPAPQLEPIDLYRTMLDYLKQLAESESPFKQLTLEEAFQLAKDNKGIVMQAIEKELPNLYDRAKK